MELYKRILEKEKSAEKEAKRVERTQKQIASEDKLPVAKLRLKILKEAVTSLTRKAKHKTWDTLLADQFMFLDGHILHMQVAFEYRMIRTKSSYTSHSMEIQRRVCTHESSIPFADYWSYKLSASYRSTVEKCPVSTQR